MPLAQTNLATTFSVLVAFLGHAAIRYHSYSSDFSTVMTKNLPPEILYEIFSLLPQDSLSKLARVSRQFNVIAMGTSLSPHCTQGPRSNYELLSKPHM
ncbi:hypothetical protein GALMADRAFT_265869 [Galerina marginata CBS 339.88]|uniref:F-box domain-containing protein n=1 Tax=Galerina marginata (strain CBS 339.88) TaxID=685588 RepID=A0A067THP6_GALM3|nr:hypothetical protein GALMADRAFT_265869 [Galerina marginata CBS 339.88]